MDRGPRQEENHGTSDPRTDTRTRTGTETTTQHAYSFSRGTRALQHLSRKTKRGCVGTWSGFEGADATRRSSLSATRPEGAASG